MRVRFEQSGGFAGLRLQAELDSDRLGARAGELERLLERARFFELPAELAAKGADRLQYLVTVERAGKEHTVRASEGSGSAELQALLRWLAAEARRRG